METKIRSTIKTIIWRIFATLNSYLILICFNNLTDANLKKAIYMNISGFFVYYFYERAWNSIKWGKIESN
jgi:hypothetical protein